MVHCWHHRQGNFAGNPSNTFFVTFKITSTTFSKRIIVSHPSARCKNNQRVLGVLFFLVRFITETLFWKTNSFYCKIPHDPEVCLVWARESFHHDRWFCLLSSLFEKRSATSLKVNDIYLVPEDLAEISQLNKKCNMVCSYSSLGRWSPQHIEEKKEETLTHDVKLLQSAGSFRLLAGACLNKTCWPWRC